MSDNEANKAGAGKGWTERQRLAYYFNLVEFSGAKLDYANAPRPDGKSVGACRIMVDRLGKSLKDELEALRSGQPSTVEEATPKKGGTPRKRKVKGKGDAGGGEEGNGTPAKRGRKKKEDVAKADVEVEVEIQAEGGEGDELRYVKAEPVDEEDVGFNGAEA
ncbi:Nn.00g109430.m01.CDS01 [Neocucurbitaria sp. VM-36]